MKSKPIPSELVLDLKSIRNAVYLIGSGGNPYERKLRYEEACKIAHDVTEKYKKLDN